MVIKKQVQHLQETAFTKTQHVCFFFNICVKNLKASSSAIPVPQHFVSSLHNADSSHTVMTPNVCFSSNEEMKSSCL